MVIGAAMGAAADAQTPAMPRDQSVWVFPADYPAEAVAQAQDGPTSAVVSLSATGAVTDCRVGISSGSRVLDRLACTLARKTAFIPAQDAKGRATVATYIAKIRWGIWRNDYEEDKSFAYQNLALTLDDQGTPKECGMSKDNTGIRLPMESCAELMEILPCALALTPIRRSMTLSATKIVAAGADAESDVQPFPNEQVLSEIRTTYQVTENGDAADCRMVSSGPLTGASLRPPSPCDSPHRAKMPVAIPPHRETTVWRISATAQIPVPMRRYENDVVLKSEPGATAPTCTGKVEQEEEQLTSLCGYLQLTVDQVRTITGHTGRMEAHLRSASRFGRQPPPDTAIPSNETTTSSWVRRFHVNALGKVEDCTDTSKGVPELDGVRPCDSFPLYDRSGPGDPGGDLYVLENMIYSYRIPPDDAKK